MGLRPHSLSLTIDGHKMIIAFKYTIELIAIISFITAIGMLCIAMGA